MEPERQGSREEHDQFDKEKDLAGLSVGGEEAEEL